MSYNIYGFVYCMVIKLIRYMILSSHNEIWQSITFGKAMPIVQNMCFLICYNRHTSFGFFLFILIFSWHTATNHRDSINTWKGARIANVYYIKKKRKEKKEKVYLRFFSSSTIIFLYSKDWFLLMIEKHTSTKKTKFLVDSSIFFSSFSFLYFFPL